MQTFLAIVGALQTQPQNLQADHFGVVGCLNWIKMADLCPLKVLAYFWLKISYSGHIFLDMDFKFVLPTIHINIKRQIQFVVNWTQIDQFIL